MGVASFSKLSAIHGVSQEFVLGPLLFLLLVNDLINLDETVLLYADDTLLVVGGATVSEVERAALEVLAAAEYWFRTNHQLNTDETQSMVCTLGRTWLASTTAPVTHSLTDG